MSNNECCICMDSNEKKMVVLDCKHEFHLDCVKKQRNQKCALCRKEHNIPIYDMVDEDEEVPYETFMGNLALIQELDYEYEPQPQYIYNPFTHQFVIDEDGNEYELDESDENSDDSENRDDSENSENEY
jgi:hypothetical protein